MKKLRETYPESNIAAIDYDPSATKVNQENRIKLMLSIAKEKLSIKQNFIYLLTYEHDTEDLKIIAHAFYQIKILIIQ